MRLLSRKYTGHKIGIPGVRFFWGTSGNTRIRKNDKGKNSETTKENFKNGKETGTDGRIQRERAEE